ncbi:HAD-IIIC family phosphatase, partial [bacterium]|nr:HAD-IIIC family phosphatase [bacterium]
TAIKLIFEESFKLVERVSKPKRKVLVIDCDNTIWGGVVGEDGIDGISVGTDGSGKIFSDIQKELLQLKKEGMLLAIASKNEHDDVISVFKDHMSMLLSIDDIISFKVNWIEKYQNINQIAEELGLGLSSFAFLDDNPLERAKVKQFLPSVHVIDLTRPNHDWPSVLRNDHELHAVHTTEEDSRKTEQYVSRVKFNKGLKHSNDIYDYLKTLDIKVRFRSVTKNDLARAVQLSQKTNQFNFTLERLSSAEISSMIKQPQRYWMKIINVQDIFGDHGEVALLIVEICGDSATVRIFNMSCRVLGRKVELKILEKLKTNFPENLYLPFKLGDRNGLLSNVMDELSAHSVPSETHGVASYNKVDKVFYLDHLEIPNQIGEVFHDD